MLNTDLLDCPVCMEQMMPPKKIFQCSNGHAFCEQCKENPALTSCPICRIEFTGANISRSILAETLAKEFTSSSSTSQNKTTTTTNITRNVLNLAQSLPDMMSSDSQEQSFPPPSEEQLKGEFLKKGFFKYTVAYIYERSRNSK